MSDLSGNDGSAVLTENIAEGGKAPDWMAQNSDDLKTNKYLSQFATIGDASKGLLGLVMERGKASKEHEDYKANKSIPKLGENPTADQQVAYLKSLGRPDAPEGYNLERPTMPDGMPYDEVLEQKLKQTAFDLGFSPTQTAGIAKALNDYGIATHNEIVKSITDDRVKSETTLKDAWKTNYEANKEKAFRAFRKFGGEQGKEWAEKNGVGNDPVFLQLMHSIFEAFGDDKFIDGAPLLGTPKTLEGQLDFSKSMPNK